ncbi:hypothetical protein ABZW47_18440 [Streptomyces sp. NPDC004549]|uniref:hypothetical protein n=1 Tax=unclassified Streptomyces TaxID=2593676 RepID=UPI0018F4D96E|nr:hypothetical protein [Streptomyces sp. DSM 110735]MBJ7906020.1 hypothetical protein [Streptomyces sp. DSM 110735]
MKPQATAEQAVERLRTALGEAGIVLPSLRIDPVTGIYGDPNALIDLGRCNVAVAARLADVLAAQGDEE